MDSDTQQWGLRARRFVVALLLIAVVFVVVEVMPLHYGQRAVPWADMLAAVRPKIPRVVLIGLGVAAMLALGGRRRAPSEDGEQGQSH